MTNKCGKCKKSILSNQDSVECSSCKIWTHRTCASLSKEEFAAISLLQDKAHWYCLVCKDKVFEALDLVKGRLSDIEDRIAILETRSNNGASQNTSNCGQNCIRCTDLKIDIDRIDQMNLASNVVISGICISDDDSLPNLVSNICAEINVPVSPSDIAYTKKLKSSRNSTPAQSNKSLILVKFYSSSTRARILKNSKLLKNSQTFKKCYINEELTPLRRKIYQKCRELRNVKYVSTRNGTIICYLDNAPQNSKPILINSPIDLQKLGLSYDSIKELGFTDHLPYTSSA